MSVCAATAQTNGVGCLQAQYSDIEALVERVKEVRLKDLLKQGIGYLHEAMHPADQEILHTLFQSGAIQVSPVTSTSYILSLYHMLYLLSI